MTKKTKLEIIDNDQEQLKEQQEQNNIVFNYIFKLTQLTSILHSIVNINNVNNESGKVKIKIEPKEFEEIENKIIEIYNLINKLFTKQQQDQQDQQETTTKEGEKNGTKQNKKW